MPVTLKGSCACKAVTFTVASHSPAPFMRCYCSICRKEAGGGGYAICLDGVAESLQVEGREHTVKFNAVIDGEVSPMDRVCCVHCGTMLWGWDPRWPDQVHPVASAIDSELPVPPHSYHIMLDFKPDWVVPEIGPNDRTFPRYPDISLADWHRQNGMWVE